MTAHRRNVYTFANFRLDQGERTLSNDGRVTTLPPKVFDTLLLLVDNAGHVLSKEEMLNAIWEGSFVEENNLAQNISALRRLLGETKDLKFIETVPKFGYRFVAPVSREAPETSGAEVIESTRARIFIRDSERFDGLPSRAKGPGFELSEFRPETLYAKNGDVNIAYQVLGEGDVDIVFVMGWVSHLEYFWKHHLFASFLHRLASMSRLILFDKRGTGLSDRVPISGLPTLEQRMEDVHAVMDAVGSERAVLIGVSEGGPMCSLFAATYPKRTAALIMIGTYAKRIRDDDYPWAPTSEQRTVFFEMLQRDWGKPVGIEERAPSLANDSEFRDWWATYLRMGASPGAAVALTKMNADIDVRNVLPSIRVPTLVIHRTGDMCLKVEEGRYVASRIPGSKFVELPGVDHLPFVGNQDEVLDAIELFLAGIRHPAEDDRVLATVMHVDLEPSPVIDRKQIADAIDLQLERFRGREVPHDSGGVLATFDGPARAIRCALAIADGAKEFGEPVRIGLHTGECDVENGVFGGFAVRLAQKISTEADVFGVAVSRTVTDLVAGSGITFEEVGVRSFDGVAGEWRLFNVLN